MSNKTLFIKIFELIGDSFCVSSTDGQKLHDQITQAFSNEYQVELSFVNIEIVTSAFLNSAIGQLYGEFTEKYIKQNLKITDIAPDDTILLEHVIESAKEYFKNPEHFDHKKHDAWGDDHE